MEFSTRTACRVRMAHCTASRIRDKRAARALIASREGGTLEEAQETAEAMTTGCEEGKPWRPPRRDNTLASPGSSGGDPIGREWTPGRHGELGRMHYCRGGYSGGRGRTREVEPDPAGSGGCLAGGADGIDGRLWG